MIKSFAIDFIRQIIVQTLEQEAFKNPDLYIGGENQLQLFSFYEQLVQQDEVDRYVEKYRDLVEQQNRTGLIANGTIVSPENPTITNLKTCTIIPLSFTCTFRTTLANRDKMIETINHLIEKFKGRKVDIAQLDNGKLFMVGTLGQNLNGGIPCITSGDFFGTYARINQLTTKCESVVSEFNGNIVSEWKNYENDELELAYVEHSSGRLDILRLAIKSGTNPAEWQIVNEDNLGDFEMYDMSFLLPPEHQTFTKWKVSLSFDTIRVDEPRTLNAEEYCTISFGGSATIVNNNVKLGNDMLWVGVSKKSIPNIEDFDIEYEYLEPLEMPSGASADTIMNQLSSNNFRNNSHTNSITITNQYTFIIDESSDLINQWFDYARYGLIGNGDNMDYDDYVSPNMVYQIDEYWCSWGNYKHKTFNAKLVGSVDVENTESDTMTITLPFQIQGGNY